MLKGYYGKEPFNFRLVALRLIRNLNLILSVTLLGTIVFGGGYYLKNVVFNNEHYYEAITTFKLSYVYEPSQAGDYCINEATWDAYIGMDDFLNPLYENLRELDADRLFEDAVDEVAGCVNVTLASDIHIPAITVITDSPEKTMVLLAACDKTMLEDFVKSNEQIAGMSILDRDEEASEKIPDVRPMRAMILSFLLSLFAVLVFVVIRELGDDSIWLYSTFTNRYGIKALGSMESKEMPANFKYIFGEKKSIGILATSDSIDPVMIKNDLEKKGIKGELIPIPAPALCPESCELMRRMDAVLAVVGAGRHSGKPFEFVLEFLVTQDIPVTAALLVDADETLIRAYYRLGKDLR